MGKIGIGFSLGGKSKLKTKKAVGLNVADDDAPEIIPKDAKISRNVGWQTETSAGPNSFGKSKTGFHAPNVPPEFTISSLKRDAPGDTVAAMGPSFQERHVASRPKVIIGYRVHYVLVH